MLLPGLSGFGGAGDAVVPGLGKDGDLVLESLATKKLSLFKIEKFSHILRVVNLSINVFENVDKII